MVKLKIQEIAEAKGVSMSKLHRSADITYRTIKLIYEDPYRDINLSTLEKIAKALHVSICDLIDENPIEISKQQNDEDTNL